MYGLGMEDVDRISESLGGGIPRRSVVLLEGKSGSGKSVWTQRMVKGVCDEGYDSSYVSSEDNIQSFLDQMSSLTYDVEDHILSGRLLFLTADIGLDDESKHSPMEDLMNSESIWESELIFVDNFEEFIIYDERIDEQVSSGNEEDGLTEFREFLESYTNQGKTIVLTVDSTGVSDDLMRPLRNTSDVHLSLSEEVIAGDVSSKMRVRKYKNMKSSVDDIIGYNIRPGRGISIRSSTVA